MSSRESGNHGPVAQLVAHLHGMQGVRGSSPLRSTDKYEMPRLRRGFFVCVVVRITASSCAPRIICIRSSNSPESPRQTMTFSAASHCCSSENITSGNGAWYTIPRAGNTYDCILESGNNSNAVTVLHR